MNKFTNEGQMGFLIDELCYRRQFNAAKKKLEREIYGEYALNTRTRESGTMIRNRKSFSAHPQAIVSETDTSSSNSSRRVSSASHKSNIVQGDELIYHKKFQEKTVVKFGKPTSNFNQSNTNCELNPDEDFADSIYDQKLLNRKQDCKLPNASLLGYNRSNSNYNKNILTDSMFEKKFQLFVEKSLHIISDIRSLIERGIDPPDGDEDISRRLLRVKEFSNRFSRNYLYPINRQLEDLNKMRTPSSTNPNQKLLSTYQVVLNGLQAYLSHLPTSIGGCSSDKLKLLLTQLIELLDVHSRMIKESEEGNYVHLITNFRLNTELTLQKIENHLTAISTDSMLKSNATRVSLAQKKAKKLRSKNSTAQRLSMYNTTSAFRKDALWKKTANSLTKKNEVKSRYKTSLFKHRPPIEILPISSNCKLFHKKSSVILKDTPHNTPPNEDNIETMIEVDNKTENNEYEIQKEEVNNEELVFKLLQLVLDNNRKKEVDDKCSKNEEKIADILSKLRNAVDTDMLQKIANGLQKNKHLETESLVKLNILNQAESSDTSIRRRKEPTVTITGPRNAKLICIKDDNSIIESDGEKNEEQERVLPIKFIASQTQTDLELNEKKNKTTQRPSTNMKRLQKSNRKLETLPKEYAVTVIQYKLDFNKFCKSNSMYRRTTSVVPWKLMSKLSDELVDFALLNVAQEIEVNEIAERLFQSELQL